MLYALGDPLSFLLLTASFLIAVTVQGWVQCVVANRAGDPQPRSEGRLRPDPRRHVDPFGAVGGLIAGFGWARPLEPLGAQARRRRGAAVAVCLSGPAVNLLLGLGALMALRVLAGVSLTGASAVVLQHGYPIGQFAQRAAILFGLMNLYVGLLGLVPLPPLPAGRLLFGLAPRTAGWQKAEYHLIEQNIGLVALLLLLLLPLGGPQALLPTVLDTLISPLVRLVTGG